MKEKLKIIWQDLKSFPYLEDNNSNPNLISGRRWKHSLTFNLKPNVLIGYELYLVQYENKKLETPKLVYSKYLVFEYNIKKWKIGQDHIYYDGRNCNYQFGPLLYSRSGGSCKKCESHSS